MPFDRFRMIGLLDLPDEIIVNILTCCTLWTDAKDRLGSEAPGRLALVNFAQTCRKASALAEPLLFCSLTIRRTWHVYNINKMLDNNEPRTYQIKDLAVAPFCNETQTEFCDLGRTISRLSHLEHLHIETPWEHNPYRSARRDNVWQKMELSFDDMITSRVNQCRIPKWSQRLKTCHLNFQAPYGEHKDIGHLATVIAAPQLRNLTLVNADLRSFKVSSLNLCRRASPLHVLTLSSCIVSHTAFAEMLSVPQALQRYSYFPPHCIF